MTDITTLSRTLNWKLLPGSHPFPGPDGGTCINEAAVVAAGFRYRAIETARDCPRCFSRPIAQYAIGINDSMPFSLRQSLLMPFVTRLAGTADSAAVEAHRASYIVMETVRRILPLVLTQLPELAEQCRQVRTLDQARVIAYDTCNAAYRANDWVAGDTAAASVDAADSAAMARNSKAVISAAYAAHDAAKAADAATVWREAAAILDGAIRLGRQAQPIETALVIERMNKIREAALQLG